MLHTETEINHGKDGKTKMKMREKREDEAPGIDVCVCLPNNNQPVSCEGIVPQIVLWCELSLVRKSTNISI